MIPIQAEHSYFHIGVNALHIWVGFLDFFLQLLFGEAGTFTKLGKHIYPSRHLYILDL